PASDNRPRAFFLQKRQTMSTDKQERGSSVAVAVAGNSRHDHGGGSEELDTSRMRWGVKDFGPSCYLRWVVVLRPIKLRTLLLRCFSAPQYDGPGGRFVEPPVIRKRTRRRILITQRVGFDI